MIFFFSSRRRHTRCALVTGVQTCALPISWHAAGLVRAALHTQNLTRLAQHSVKLYRELEAETGQATGFKQNGSISIATNADRWEEFRRGASVVRAFGVEAEPIGAVEVKDKWPLLNVDDKPEERRGGKGGGSTFGSRGGP